MAAILADDIFKCISWIRVTEKFLFKFHWNCSDDSNWQQAGFGSGYGLAPKRQQAINWNNADPVHWRIYVAFGWDRLRLWEWKSKIVFEKTLFANIIQINFSFNCGQPPYVRRRLYQSLPWLHRLHLLHRTVCNWYTWELMYHVISCQSDTLGVGLCIRSYYFDSWVE